MPTPRKAPPRSGTPAKKSGKGQPKARPPTKPSGKKPAAKSVPKRGPPPKKAGGPTRPKGGSGKGSAAEAAIDATPARTVGRAHLLSLSFLRDGDEFLARLETDSGQITELKNRFLDQLLSLVANELEDLLE
ncbi:MAG TPA: hypothetical protein VGS23_07370 [Thermoplasmata archaeon]|nr:hypothetical protein [Thermoplasmata archaeon]